METEEVNGHVFAKQSDTAFCLNMCGCYRDRNGLGGPDGVDLTGRCPNNPESSAVQILQKGLEDPCFHL